MKRKGKCFFILVCFLQIGCNDQSINNSVNRDNVFDDIKSINLDNFKNIDITLRTDSLMMFRYKLPSEELDSSMFLLLKELKSNIVHYKVNNKWFPIKRLEKQLFTTKLSRERIIYCYNIMLDFDLENVNNLSDSDVVFITKFDMKFYYVYNENYFSKYNPREEYENLKGNWWVRRE
jgi:hypothetical protein